MGSVLPSTGGLGHHLAKGRMMGHSGENALNGMGTGACGDRKYQVRKGIDPPKFFPDAPETTVACQDHLHSLVGDDYRREVGTEAA